MNKELSSLILVLCLVACSNKKSSDIVTDIDSPFSELSIDEKAKILTAKNDEFTGDFLKYVGANSDSSGFLELLLDRNKRFAIRTRQAILDRTIKSDSGEVREFSFDNGVQNICIGRWTEGEHGLGLQFLLCGANMFDSTRNTESVNFIDMQTVLLKKDAKQLWIWKTQCNKQ